MVMLFDLSKSISMIVFYFDFIQLFRFNNTKLAHLLLNVL